MSCRIVVSGALLQAAVVPSSAAPFDFQAEYRLSNQLVRVLSLCGLCWPDSMTPDPHCYFSILDVGGGSSGQEQKAFICSSSMVQKTSLWPHVLCISLPL